MIARDRGRLGSVPGGSAIRAVWQKFATRLTVFGDVTLGQSVRIGSGTIIRSFHGLHIEDDVAIGRNCTIEVAGRIGSKTLIAANVGIVGRSDHAIDEIGITILEATWVGDRGASPSDRIDIGEGVWIGYGSVILSGISIGDGAVIGAGSVVTRNVDPYTIVGGNPASLIRQRFTREVGVQVDDSL